LLNFFSKASKIVVEIDNKRSNIDENGDNSVTIWGSHTPTFWPCTIHTSPSKLMDIRSKNNTTVVISSKHSKAHINDVKWWSLVLHSTVANQEIYTTVVRE